MMVIVKPALVLLVVLLAGAMPRATSQAQPPERIGNTGTMIFVWARDVGDRNKTRPLGSGFLIDHAGHAITAKHVVDRRVQGEDLVVSIESKSSNPVIADDDIDCAPAADICIIRIPPDVVARITEFYKVGCYLPEGDEQLRAVGFPGGGDPFSTLIQPIGRVLGAPVAGSLIPTDVAMQEGMSGGPVFDATGTVVGIVRGSDQNNPTQTFVAPLQRARSKLADRGIDCPVQPPHAWLKPRSDTVLFNTTNTPDSWLAQVQREINFLLERIHVYPIMDGQGKLVNEISTKEQLAFLKQNGVKHYIETEIYDDTHQDVRNTAVRFTMKKLTAPQEDFASSILFTRTIGVGSVDRIEEGAQTACASGMTEFWRHLQRVLSPPDEEPKEVAIGPVEQLDKLRLRMAVEVMPYIEMERGEDRQKLFVGCIVLDPPELNRCDARLSRYITTHYYEHLSESDLLKGYRVKGINHESFDTFCESKQSSDLAAELHGTPYDHAVYGILGGESTSRTVEVYWNDLNSSEDNFQRYRILDASGEVEIAAEVAKVALELVPTKKGAE